MRFPSGVVTYAVTLDVDAALALPVCIATVDALEPASFFLKFTMLIFHSAVVAVCCLLSRLRHGLDTDYRSDSVHGFLFPFSLGQRCVRLHSLPCLSAVSTAARSVAVCTAAASGCVLPVVVMRVRAYGSNLLMAQAHAGALKKCKIPKWPSDEFSGSP